MKQTPHHVSFGDKKPAETKVINITPVIIFLLFLCGGVVAFVAGGIFSFIKGTYKTLPDTEAISSIQPAAVTRVFDKDSVLIHEFSIERRFWVPLDSINDNMKNAVIAIEDQRFYKHWGIDLKRIGGAAIANIIRHGYSQGASTLTQQLARNLFFSSEKTLMRKVREMLTAVKLERHYSKDEILELYLNQIYLGAGVYGVEAAAQKYFGKKASTLSLSEATIIAGTIQRPEAYRPDREKNIERISLRRKLVLRAMTRLKFITSQEAKDAQDEEAKSLPTQDISATAPYFVETVRQYIESKYGETVLYTGGLNIYTTLDSKAQEEAEYAYKNHLDTLQAIPNRIFLAANQPWQKTPDLNRAKWYANFDSLYKAHDTLFFDEKGRSLLNDSLALRKIQASVIALETRTGAVRVMIGGRNFDNSKFNRAIQAVRQPGSSIKPFVYAAALIEGYTLATRVVDAPFSLGDWSPQNYEHSYAGSVTFRNALKKSINIPAVKVLLDIGADKVVTLVRRMGFTHDMPEVPALALGAGEVTNIEMTSAYAAFANRGMQAKPYYVEQITTRNGRVIERAEPVSIQVLDTPIADLMAQMMRSVVDHGTAFQVRSMGFRRPAAGKTGTTNNNSDAWFVGFTPQIACGVWLGIDERRSMGSAITGSHGAIPIWTTTMTSLHRNLPEEQFKLDSSIVSLQISKGFNPTDSSIAEMYSEYFLKTNTPNDTNSSLGEPATITDSLVELNNEVLEGMPNPITGALPQPKTPASETPKQPVATPAKVEPAPIVSPVAKPAEKLKPAEKKARSEMRREEKASNERKKP